MFKSRKGQLTLFLLLGFILLSGFAIYWAIQSFVVDEEFKIENEVIASAPSQIKPIVKYVQECIRRVSLPLLELLGSQGGYVKLPDEVLSTPNNQIGYGYVEGDKRLPSRAELETEIATYMNLAVDDCANFSSFEEQGFSISKGEINTFTTVGDEKVTHRIEYPLSIIKNGKVTEFRDFRYETRIRLGKMYDSASLIVDKIIEEPEYIDYNFLSQFEFNISIVPIDFSNVLYAIRDENVKVGGKSYVFMFGAKIKVNSPPSIAVDKVHYLTQKKEFTLQINAEDPEGDKLVYEDDSGMFDISDSGLIRFTPMIPGEYDVVITVRDERSNTAKKRLQLIVLKEGQQGVKKIQQIDSGDTITKVKTTI